MSYRFYSFSEPGDRLPDTVSQWKVCAQTTPSRKELAREQAVNLQYVVQLSSLAMGVLLKLAVSQQSLMDILKFDNYEASWFAHVPEFVHQDLLPVEPKEVYEAYRNDDIETVVGKR